MLFVCPKCKCALTIHPDGRAVCENRHSFDRSREGYYNLLLTSTGGTHGDNREMVLARRDFLDTGAYLPLADKIFELARPYISSGCSVLDSGCGEGYYTNYIEEKISRLFADVSVSGFDISKDAVRYAAKKNPRLSLAVAGAYHIPVADGSVDLLFSIFAPLAQSEFLRVIRSGGHFIMAIPGEEHLYSLKRQLYDTPYKNTVEDTALEGFSLVKLERISFTLDLDSPQKIASLFMMTPYAYRTPKQAKERILSLDRLKTEAQFIILVYEKN